jgi:hypothetical protein
MTWIEITETEYIEALEVLAPALRTSLRSTRTGAPVPGRRARGSPGLLRGPNSDTLYCRLLQGAQHGHGGLKRRHCFAVP